MILKIRKSIRLIVRYLRDLEEYKWKYGSSCCTPSHCDLEHNPLGLDEPSSHRKKLTQ
ncbi:MAG: hypothetical protein P8Y60_20815 [Calditrichota bacterium]